MAGPHRTMAGGEVQEIPKNLPCRVDRVSLGTVSRGHTVTPTVSPPSARPTPATPAPLSAPRPVPLTPWRPQPKRWTCKEFHQLGDMGWFEGKRAILINGEILEMPGPKPPHATATTLVDAVLRAVFGAPQYFVRPQMPLVFGLSTDPEPDIAVIAGSP